MRTLVGPTGFGRRVGGEVRDAVALMHEHRVSQVPVVSANDSQTIAGAVTERGLLRRAVEDPSLLNEEVIEVMEPPFHAVPCEESVSDAVEILSGVGEAVLVTDGGLPIGIVTRADLVESLAT